MAVVVCCNNSTRPSTTAQLSAKPHFDADVLTCITATFTCPYPTANAKYVEGVCNTAACSCYMSRTFASCGFSMVLVLLLLLLTC